MRKSVSFFGSLTLAVLMLLSAQLGCSSGPNLNAVYSTNIKKLYACYIMYLESHEFKGPKTEAEFKDFLKNDPTAIYLIKKIDLTPDDVDDLFVSERDGEPFVIRYGLRGVADHAIIFEAKGVDGKRLVALADPTECGQQDYDDWLSGKKKPETESGTEGIDENSD